MQVSINLYMITTGKLKGMNEHCLTLPHSIDQDGVKNICAKIFRAANLASIASNSSVLRYCHDSISQLLYTTIKFLKFFLRYAGQTLSSKSLVLVTITIGENPKLTVNCEKMIIGSMLSAELKDALKD